MTLRGFGLVAVAAGMALAVVARADEPVDLEAFEASDNVFVIDPAFASFVLVDDVLATLRSDAAVTAEAGRFLAFDFDFLVGQAVFSAALLDATLAPEDQVLEVFLVDVPGPGTHAFDLGPYAGRTLGLTFELAGNPGDGGESIVDLENVCVVDPSPDDPSQVPGCPVVDVPDDDADDDGVPDAGDNCPADANADQSDLDGDGAGDLCDDDIDGDGVANAEDAFPEDPAESADHDGDGVGDGADPDDDNDGQSDEDETACGSDPLDAGSTAADADGDGQPDCVEPDADNDGVDDDVDVCPGTVLPEQVPLAGRLGRYRWALVDDSGTFATGASATPFTFTIADTGGCSCEQIVIAHGSTRSRHPDRSGGRDKRHDDHRGGHHGKLGRSGYGQGMPADAWVTTTLRRGCPTRLLRHWVHSLDGEVWLDDTPTGNHPGGHGRGSRHDAGCRD